MINKKIFLIFLILFSLLVNPNRLFAQSTKINENEIVEKLKNLFIDILIENVEGMNSTRENQKKYNYVLDKKISELDIKNYSNELWYGLEEKKTDFHRKKIIEEIKSYLEYEQKKLEIAIDNLENVVNYKIEVPNIIKTGITDINKIVEKIHEEISKSNDGQTPIKIDKALINDVIEEYNKRSIETQIKLIINEIKNEYQLDGLKIFLDNKNIKNILDNGIELNTSNIKDLISIIKIEKPGLFHNNLHSSPAPSRTPDSIPTTHLDPSGKSYYTVGIYFVIAFLVLVIIILTMHMSKIKEVVKKLEHLLKRYENETINALKIEVSEKLDKSDKNLNNVIDILIVIYLQLESIDFDSKQNIPKLISDIEKSLKEAINISSSKNEILALNKSIMNALNLYTLHHDENCCNQINNIVENVNGLLGNYLFTKNTEDRQTNSNQETRNKYLVKKNKEEIKTEGTKLNLSNLKVELQQYILKIINFYNQSKFNNDKEYDEFNKQFEQVNIKVENAELLNRNYGDDPIFVESKSPPDYLMYSFKNYNSKKYPIYACVPTFGVRVNDNVYKGAALNFVYKFEGYENGKIFKIRELKKLALFYKDNNNEFKLFCKGELELIETN